MKSIKSISNLKSIITLILKSIAFFLFSQSVYASSESCLALSPADASKCLSLLDTQKNCQFGSLRDRATCIDSASQKPTSNINPEEVKSTQKSAPKGINPEAISQPSEFHIKGYNVSSTINYKGQCVAQIKYDMHDKSRYLIDLSKGSILHTSRDSNFLCNKNVKCIYEFTRDGIASEKGTDTVGQLIAIDYSPYKEAVIAAESFYKIAKFCETYNVSQEVWLREIDSFKQGNVSRSQKTQGTGGSPFSGILLALPFVGYIWYSRKKKMATQSAASERHQKMIKEANDVIEEIKAGGTYTSGDISQVTPAIRNSLKLCTRASLIKVRKGSDSINLGTRVSLAGIPVYIGKSVSYAKNEVSRDGTGMLILTDKSVIYVGESENFTTNRANISSIDISPDILRINLQNRGAPVYIEVENPFLWRAALLLNHFDGQSN